MEPTLQLVQALTPYALTREEFNMGLYSSGGIGGSTGNIANAFTRANGTGGNTLQAGGTNPPTYDDNGIISAIAAILRRTSGSPALSLGTGADSSFDMTFT